MAKQTEIAPYARRVWIFPIILTPLVWPAYIFDSPRLMAIQNVLLAVSNVWLLITVMPVWRRKAILAIPETFQTQGSDEQKGWRGIAFEQVCWQHIQQIKRALGIEGVKSSIFLRCFTPSQGI